MTRAEGHRDRGTQVTGRWKAFVVRAGFKWDTLEGGGDDARSLRVMLIVVLTGATGCQDSGGFVRYVSLSYFGRVVSVFTGLCLVWFSEI